jgi:hypothetical protein
MPEARRKREISESETEIPRGEEQKEQLIPALLMSVVEEVCSAMSASGAVIAVLDSQGIRCLASTGEAPPIGARLPPDSSFSAECFKTGMVVLRDEAKGDSRIPLSLDGSRPVRSAVAVPILSEGSVIGTIEVFASEPSAAYAGNIAPLEGIADFLAPIVALASGYAQPGTDRSTLEAIHTETPLFAEQQPGVRQDGPTFGVIQAETPSFAEQWPAVRQDDPTLGAIQTETPSFAEQRPAVRQDGPTLGAIQTKTPSFAEQRPAVRQDDPTLGAIQTKTPSFAEQRPAVRQDGPTLGAIQTKTPSFAEQRPAVRQDGPTLGTIQTETPSFAEQRPAVRQDGPTLGTIQTETPSFAEQRPGVQQVVGKTTIVRAWAADSAAKLFRRFGENATARKWLVGATPLLFLALVLAFVGLRHRVSKTSSGILVPPAAGWAEHNDSAGAAENEARYKVEAPGQKNAGGSRPGVAISSEPQPLSNGGQGKGADEGKPRAAASPGSPVDLVKRMESIFSSGPAQGSASRLQDSKPRAPVGREGLGSSPSSALGVEEAKLEAPEVAAKTPVPELAPSVTAAIEPAISRPDFVLDHTLKGHSGWVTGVAFSSDGRRLASGSWDQTVKLWDVPTGKELNVVGSKMSKMKEVQAVAFSRDGHWLAVENSNDTVTLWDATTETETHTLPSNKPLRPLGKNWVYSIAFSPDGRWLASGVDDKTVRIWDVRSGRAVRDLTGLRRSVIYAAFSPDGRWLASGDDDKSIRIWEVSSGKEIRRLTGHKKPIYAVAFSPNGRWLASASADKTIKLWDIEAGREVQTLTGHGDQVTSVSYSPDGRWLASGSRDKTIKIWDVETGQELQTLGAHDHSIYTVAFDSRGRWLASGSEDGTISLWRLSGVGVQTTLQ